MIRTNDRRVDRIMAQKKEQTRFVNGRTYRIPAASTAAASTPVERLLDGAWKGQPCFIVGGGASLLGFDFGRLRGRGKIIAINKSFESVPFADIHFFMDYKYMDRILSGISGLESLNKWTSFQGRRVFLNVSDYNVPEGVIGLHPAVRGHLPASIAEGIMRGNNSTVGAIGLAYALGASPIYLLGVDGKQGGADGKTVHFHGGYGKPTSTDVLASFVRDLEDQARLLKAAGVKVVNLNPASALGCYPKVSVDEVLPLATGEAYFNGCLGFGDGFYQRPILRALAPHYATLYIQTTCPDLYWDIPNIKFLLPGSVRLRTQAKYLASLPKSTFTSLPAGVPSLGWRYQWDLASGENHVESLRQRSGVPLDQFDFTFPVKPEWILAAREVMAKFDMKGKRLCIVRPSTIRKEWFNASRNPKAVNLQRLIDRYKDEYFYLGFADLEPDVEWLDGELQGIDAAFLNGELPLTTIFGLIKLSDMVITGPTWVMVASIAERVKCFTVFGGCAKPERIVDASMGLDRFGYVAPEPFCDCRRGDHACNKDIPAVKIIQRFEELRSRSVWQ
ncbi:MAG: hypothetical protein M0R06_03205 [Sphaerochaeta sp.]|nr:hypothetical protein [Sphaerochaeta sp.]